MLKVLVTGARGFLGSTFKEFESEKIKIINLAREVDLRNYRSTRYAIKLYKPDVIIHTAGRVGGMALNINNPVSQYTDNILINTNVVDAAHHSGVKRLIAFSSIVGFPSSSTKLDEGMFQEGEPNTLYMSYACTKRAMDIHIESYRAQHGADYCSAIIGNTFGETDNYNLDNAHVVAGLISKADLASRNKTSLKVWGDGSDCREFTYYKDITKICLELAKSKNSLPRRLILSSGQSFSIKEIAKVIASKFKVSKIEWESNKKLSRVVVGLDNSLLYSYLPKFKFTKVEKAIKDCCNYFIENRK